MATEAIQLRNLDRGVLIGADPALGSLPDKEEPVFAPEPQPASAEFSLPPVDTGKEAWLFLTACWFVEAFTFGFEFSFGVFQDYYSSHAPFAGSGNIAVIGTTTSPRDLPKF
ncbi:hypothetical protein KJ359_006702 [Pestalotiopsis sp. 9143b]|nr:hypothetical protein KJ359_006702 [Pestalotiopsis sp. 9143b]